MQPEFTKSIDLNLEENSESYFQVFAERHGFQPNLSILDLIFNEGPVAMDYLVLDTAHGRDLES